MSRLSLEAGKRARDVLNYCDDAKSVTFSKLCQEAGQTHFCGLDVCSMFYLFLEQYLLGEKDAKS